MSKDLVYSPKEIQIAESAAEWNTPSQLSEMYQLPMEVVFTILDDPKIQKYIQFYSNRLDLWLQLKRIKAAHELLPEILLWIRLIIQSKSALKWSMADFKFIELLLKQLDKAEQKAIIFNANINVQEDHFETVNKKKTNELDAILSALPLKYLNQFWENSLETAKQLKLQYDYERQSATTTIELQEISQSTWS